MAKALWKTKNPGKTLKHQRYLLSKGAIKQLPWLKDEYLIVPSEVTFGAKFPKAAVKGNMFLRTDTFPNKLYKFNGNGWIEVDKNLVNHYTYNEAYIEYLKNKVLVGEYDIELLTEAEREQVESRIESRI